MKPQSTQRKTLRTLKEYPLRDITEKIISCVDLSESSLITWARSVRKFI